MISKFFSLSSKIIFVTSHAFTINSPVTFWAPSLVRTKLCLKYSSNLLQGLLSSVPIQNSSVNLYTENLYCFVVAENHITFYQNLYPLYRPYISLERNIRLPSCT